VLAAAILVHASTRPPQVVAAPVNTAQIEQRIHAEVTKRLDAEVGKAVARVVAESEARQQRSAAMLAAAEKRFQAQRQEDIAMIEQTGRYYQSKLGQLMVASNNYAGGAR
jgi:23S rRNA pseudoU1915 N3-methylase RlmH